MNFPGSASAKVARAPFPRPVILRTQKRKSVIVSSEMTLSSVARDWVPAFRKRAGGSRSPQRDGKKSRLRRPSFAIVFGLERSDRTRGASPIGRSRRRSSKADPPAHSDFQHFTYHVIRNGAGNDGRSRRISNVRGFSRGAAGASQLNARLPIVNVTRSRFCEEDRILEVLRLRCARLAASAPLRMTMLATTLAPSAERQRSDTKRAANNADF